MRRDFFAGGDVEAEVKLGKVGEAEHCLQRKKVDQKFLQIADVRYNTNEYFKEDI